MAPDAPAAHTQLSSSRAGSTAGTRGRPPRNPAARAASDPPPSPAAADHIPCSPGRARRPSRRGAHAAPPPVCRGLPGWQACDERDPVQPNRRFLVVYLSVLASLGAVLVWALANCGCE